MKKFVFASVMALASISLVNAPMLRAQDTGTISIKDPAEFNAYQNATTQSDPKAKAAALEAFLQAYPQSVVKNTVLDMLVDTYQGLGDADRILSASNRLLQVDPNNLKAVLYSVLVKKSQGSKANPPDTQALDDAAALARKGLTVPKPAKVSADDWKKLTGAAFPIFHSAIALDDVISKKDFKAAQDEYKQELMLYTDEQSKTVGLNDTLLLAQAYSQPGAAQDLVQAVWFYARVFDFAPAAYKSQIEPKLNYYYKKYHGAMDGLDDLKAKAAATTFVPGDLTIKPAPTPAERIHQIVAETPNLATLALADKELILAFGSKEDADKLWALLKDQTTPVPGTVIEAPATGLKISLTQAAKTAEFVVALQAPAACGSIPAGADVKALKDFILANGVKADTDKIEALSPDYTKPISKLAVEGTVSVIKVAVTDDAKTGKLPDFVVNLKTPVSCKETPAAGSAFGLQSKGDAELDGTYDTFAVLPPTATTAQAVQIVLKEGFIQPEKKKAAPVAHKPAAGHKPAAH
jgi:hypothetical protein